MDVFLRVIVSAALIAMTTILTGCGDGQGNTGNVQEASAVKNSSDASAPPPDPPENAPAVPETPAEPPLDGIFLYGKYCAGCHGQLAVSTKSNKTADRIKQTMGSLGLSDAEIQAIATALIK